MDRFPAFPMLISFSLFIMFMSLTYQNTTIGRIALVFAYFGLMAGLFDLNDKLVEIWEEIQNVKEKL